MVARGCGEERTGRAQRIVGAVKLHCTVPQRWTQVVTHSSKPAVPATPRGTPNVNYELWVMITCQRRFECSKRSIWWGSCSWGRLCTCVCV